jgi:phage-related protein
MSSSSATHAARIEAGSLIRLLQAGEMLSLPHSRPMSEIGPRCHELRVNDENISWRIVYRLDADPVVIIDWFAKKTRATPNSVINACRRRLRDYDRLRGSIPDG